MAMELQMLSQNSIPEGTFLSVRAGSARRQAAINCGKPFRFPRLDIEESPVKVDILQSIGTAYLVIKPGEERYQAIFHGDGPEGMTCEFGIRPATGTDTGGKDMTMPEKVPTSDETQTYLEKHRILPFVQAILQTVIKERPEDPFAHVARHFSCGYEPTDKNSPYTQSRLGASARTSTVGSPTGTYGTYDRYEPTSCVSSPSIPQTWQINAPRPGEAFAAQRPGEAFAAQAASTSKAVPPPLPSNEMDTTMRPSEPSAKSVPPSFAAAPRPVVGPKSQLPKSNFKAYYTAHILKTAGPAPSLFAKFPSKVTKGVSKPKPEVTAAVTAEVTTEVMPFERHPSVGTWLSPRSSGLKRMKLPKEVQEKADPMYPLNQLKTDFRSYYTQHISKTAFPAPAMQSLMAKFPNKAPKKADPMGPRKQLKADFRAYYTQNMSKSAFPAPAMQSLMAKFPTKAPLKMQRARAPFERLPSVGTWVQLAPKKPIAAQAAKTEERLPIGRIPSVATWIKRAPKKQSLAAQAAAAPAAEEAPPAKKNPYVMASTNMGPAFYARGMAQGIVHIL